MHGRPRKAPKPEDAAVSAIKAEKLRSLQSQLLHNHHNKIYTTEAVDLSAKLLETNPESYTAWNYRKLAVEHNLSQSSESDPDSINSILNEELRILESALRQNFKSYGAWHHRKWILSKGHSSIDHELRLLDKFQKADSRNFHAWNYRRFVAELMHRSEEEELKYTTDMIDNNFSNYSAWHNLDQHDKKSKLCSGCFDYLHIITILRGLCSVLLSHLLEKEVQGFIPKERVLTEEFELVHQAIFTDPDDQSGWFYHLWLLDQAVKSDAPLLAHSWPDHGSDITVSADSYLDGHALSPFSFHFDTRTFPLILYFNQAVKGVNPHTVTVEFAYNSNEDLIWRPLSTRKSGAAQAWVTRLNFPNIKLDSLKAYPVKVSLGHTQGIISSSDFHCRHPYQIEFRVSVQPPNSEQSQRQGMQKVLWGDEKFHIYDTRVQNSSPIVSFDQLTIEEDHVAMASSWQMESIANEITLFRELLAEINCKIGKLTLARLLVHESMMSRNSSYADKTAHYEEALKLFNDLIKLDPPHSQYYRDEHSLVLLQQVTSSKESLLKHCYQYRDSTFPNICTSLCLRLNNFSLSRMGSIERLLWVQMLDLSHNELRSIEGLEAMQLLFSLNLSNNKLCSVTALEPLRQLKSLKVLDISHNEIGAHSIDTKRYLCASPLSHTFTGDWNFDEIATDDGNVTNYWEAYLIFKDLNLTQLDILGNVITDEKFKSFLVRVLRKLRWLDGEQLL